MPARHATQNKINLKDMLLMLPVIAFLLILTVGNLYLIYKPAEVVEVKIAKQDNKALWNQLIMKYPSYRDGYLELAKLAYKNGDMELFRTLIAQSEKIDPFSSEVYRMKNVLGSRSL